MKRREKEGGKGKVNILLRGKMVIIFFKMAGMNSKWEWSVYLEPPTSFSKDITTPDVKMPP